MTPDFIISRYPDIIGEVPYEVYDEETAKERLENAKDRLDFRGDEKIRKFINKLKEKFKPYKIILFGSRARGDYLEESDYDLIIVSDYFKGMPFLKRMKEVYGLYDLDVNVDII
ncbi:MAG: nucleotidyltransferase domain-containing protein, partial [Methanocaldococcus sp.]